MVNYKTYIGSVIVKATPMTEVEFMGSSPKLQAMGFSNIGIDEVDGYRVVQANGAIVWRSKKDFDAKFRELTRGEVMCCVE